MKSRYGLCPSDLAVKLNLLINKCKLSELNWVEWDQKCSIQTKILLPKVTVYGLVKQFTQHFYTVQYAGDYTLNTDQL